MPKYRASQVVSLGALTVALALVGVLGTQNRSLERRYAALAEQARLPYVGLTVPPFDAATLDGDSVRIGKSGEGSAQILFFFTTTCPYCRATLPAWNRIASEAGKQGEVAIYGIQLDSAQSGLEYAEEHGLGFPLVTLPDPRIRQWYRVRLVPTTVVLDRTGLVVYARGGEITARETIDSVLAATRKAVLPEVSDSIIAGATGVVTERRWLAQQSEFRDL